MNVVICKPGVRFDVIAPAGFRLLGAIERAARSSGRDLMVTCGTEAHPATDPHSLGEAFDLRTHGLTDLEKETLLRRILLDVSEGPLVDPLMDASGGIASRYFWGWIEHPGEPAEHLHVQRRKGLTYPPPGIT